MSTTPFLPQEGISSAILQAISAANQKKQSDQENTARQQQLSIAQTEANTASQRLGVEAPLISAQTDELRTKLNLQKSISQALDVDHPDSQSDVSKQHIYDIAGPHATLHPDDLNISNPLGQALAQPSAPGGDNSTPSSGPQGDLFQRHAIALGNSIGGYSPSEMRDVQLAHERLKMNPTIEGAQQYQKDLSDIVKRRDNPDYQKQLQYEKSGMSEYDAKRSVISDNAVQASLSKLENDPQAISGNNALAAGYQLASLAKQPNLSPDTQQRIANLQDVVAQTAKNANKTDFESWREAYKRSHNGAEPTTDAIEKYKSSNALTIVQGKGDLTNKSYYDTQNNTVEQMTPNEFNTAKKTEPSRYLEYTNALQRNLNAHSLVGSIRDGVSQLQSDYDNNQVPGGFDKTTTSIMGAALRSSDKDTFNTLKAKIAYENLDPQQTQYVNDLLQLHERLLSLRGLQQSGAGSESQREAIFALAPTLGDTPASAKQKMASITNELVNVEKAYPKVGNSNVSAREQRLASQGPASSGQISVTDPNGGVHTFATQADADKFKSLAGIK